MRREEYYDEDDAIQIKKKKRPANSIQSSRASATSVNSQTSRSSSPVSGTQTNGNARPVSGVQISGRAASVQNGGRAYSSAQTQRTGGAVATADRSRTVSSAQNNRNAQADSPRRPSAPDGYRASSDVQSNRGRRYAQNNSASKLSDTQTDTKGSSSVSAQSYRSLKNNSEISSSDAPAYRKKNSYSATNIRTVGKKNSFKKPYIIFLSVLLVFAVFTIGYVYASLLDYEKSQPENVVLSEIDDIKSYAKKGKIEDIISLTTYRNTYSLTDEQVHEFEKNFVADEITVKENAEGTDAETKAFDVLEDGYKVATAKLKHVGQETKLIIFTLDRWELETFTVTGYDIRFAVPSSIVVKNNGEVIEGEPSENGRSNFYAIISLVKPDIEISDLLGNSEKYNQQNTPTITEYKIKIPSDYTIKGEKVVPLESAVVEPIKEFEYARDYVEGIPDNATYTLGILSDTFDAEILDKNGNPVEYTLDGHKVEISTDVTYKTELPDSIKNEIDPLEPVRLWSLLMTNDLDGATHGYGKVKQYLIEGSYLEETAKKWATGVDITFTSIHRLENPVFRVEEATNFKVYSENFFSCDITLTKKMIFRDNTTADDTIHSTFYYVKYDDTDNGVDDAHWAIVDYRAIGD